MRGQIPFSVFRIFELTLAAVAGLILLTAGGSLSDYMAHKTWTKEIGTTLTAAQIPQGNLWYLVYSRQPLKDVSVQIEQNKVRIANHEHQYPIDMNNPPKILDVRTPQIKIFKEANGLTITDQSNRRKFHPLKQTCGKQKTRLQKLIIDFEESTRKIAAPLPYSTTKSVTEPQQLTPEERLRAIQDADTVLSINANTEDPLRNNIVAYVNENPDSKKLACMLLNRLTALSVDKSTGAAIVPVKLDHLPKDDPKQVLQAKTAVYIELGNTRNPRNALLKNPLQTTTEIQEALRQYG